MSLNASEIPVENTGLPFFAGKQFDGDFVVLNKKAIVDAFNVGSIDKEYQVVVEVSPSGNVIFEDCGTTPPPPPPPSTILVDGLVKMLECVDLSLRTDLGYFYKKCANLFTEVDTDLDYEMIQ